MANKKCPVISCRKRKAIADFMLFLLIVVAAAGLVFFMGLFFGYVPLASNIASIQTSLNVYMTNDDVGTELVSLLNAKTADVKHMELLGRFTLDGMNEEYLQPVSKTLESACTHYEFSLKGSKEVSFSKGTSPAVQDSTKMAVNCGVSPSETLNMPWPLPTNWNYINSGFGGRDLSKEFGIKGCDCHAGIDIKADRGSDVFAVADGIITEAYGLCAEGNKDCNHKYGNSITIRHDSGKLGKSTYFTHYSHLTSVLVKVGDPVTKGARIGTTGNTGLSSGPHLHFEIRDSTDNGDTNSINPCNYFLSSMPIAKMIGLKCEHEEVSVCTYVSGPSVKSYQTDIPLPGPRSGANLRGQLVFKQWE
ncbi:MAG: M23 family metallopeptidase [Candidatus Aenigmarchaeota archaeon]|nr:M23 family metallopeptidase [Candidatus Aenigmarchaeota archaeon]